MVGDAVTDAHFFLRLHPLHPDVLDGVVEEVEYELPLIDVGGDGNAHDRVTTLHLHEFQRGHIT